jgi:hypothetical protein
VTLGVSENSSLWNVHFTGDFAQVNPGCLPRLNLLPSFVSDLSAHTLSRKHINAWSLVQFKIFPEPSSTLLTPDAAGPWLNRLHQ